jgi:hypothetical protein
MVALFASGCAMMAPTYSPSVQNAQALKDTQVQSARVGEFTNQPGKGNANPISIRGSKLNSPYQNSYSSYLAAAVREELLLAGKLKDDSQVEITGTLLKNDIDASGFSEATGNVEARFVVKHGGAVRYDEVKAINDTWDSSFVGSVAIPRAQQRYPVIVQKLLTALFADPKFIEALK